MIDIISIKPYLQERYYGVRILAVKRKIFDEVVKQIETINQINPPQAMRTLNLLETFTKMPEKLGYWTDVLMYFCSRSTLSQIPVPFSPIEKYLEWGVVHYDRP